MWRNLPGRNSVVPILPQQRLEKKLLDGIDGNLGSEFRQKVGSNLFLCSVVAREDACTAFTVRGDVAVI